MFLRAMAARGLVLFFQSTGTQCKNCHKIGDQGRRLPDLSLIGRSSIRPKLLESILEPSKTIDPQIRLASGRNERRGEFTTGLLVKRTDTNSS